MAKVAVSIAMATYNGAAYLQEQLDSFLAQTRLPDELVICDDTSGDATVEILEHFARSAPFPVSIQVNESNVGSTRNFDRAIGLCRGDVICMADQDDIWHPDKVEKVLQAFSDPDIDMVFSDADLVDASGRHLDYRLWAAVGFTRSLQKRWMRGQALDTLLRRRIVTGATLAFRAHLRQVISPISTAWVHDAWIALLVAARYRGAFIAEPLIDYRQHGSNQIGARRSNVLQIMKGFLAVRRKDERVAQLRRRMDAYRAVQARLNALGAKADVQQQLRAVVEHLGRRAQAIESRGLSRYPLVLSELATGRYRIYSQGNMKAIVDLFGK